VHAHRVDVLDRAHDHHVVRAVAHDLELELTPAEHGLVDQDLADGGRGEPAGHDAVELGGVADDPAAAAAEREGRAHDQRQPELADRRARLAEARGDQVARGP
jgi:hypothetical protein